MSPPTNPVPQFPAHLLTGIEIDGGWRVVKRLTGDATKDGHTPGFFSVGYLAERGTERAFLKAFDLQAVMTLNGAGNGDPSAMMRSLQELTGAFNAEYSILQFCSQIKLDRIVKTIGTGYATPPSGAPVAFPMPVPYLLFELAEGDIRTVVGKADRAEDHWRLKYLHEVAIGLQQLHAHRIAHQDLKPANVLVFEKEGAKIADLGRASRDGVPAPHDNSGIPGDRRFAPPELRYGEVPTSWVDRREASDLYHLGSLMTFVFAGVSINVGIDNALPPELRPGAWRGRYVDVLPHVQAAFTKFLAEVGPLFPEWARSDLLILLTQMCNPDYRQRGAPDARAQANNPIGMDRFVSSFDRLAKQAAIKVRQAV